MVLLHLGAAFQVNSAQQITSPWHHLAPRSRIICAILFVCATALTPNGQWLTWAIYAAGLAIFIAISRIPLSVLLKRVAVEFIFVGAVLLGTLFREGGSVFWQWGIFRITTDGLTVLGSVTLKVLLCLFMLNLLVLTTAVPALLHALAGLRVPPLLIAIFASMYRYLGVLMDEFSTLRRAAAARNLDHNRRWYRVLVGNMIGSLFIRTYERGDRIYQAMLARGYTGLPPTTELPRTGKMDRAAIVATLALILLGQLIPPSL